MHILNALLSHNKNSGNISNLFAILASAEETWLDSARLRKAIFCSTSIHHVAKLSIVDFSVCRSMCIGWEFFNLSLEERFVYSKASMVLLFICFPLNLFYCSRSSSIVNTTFSRMPLSEKMLFLRTDFKGHEVSFSNNDSSFKAKN